MSVPPMTDAIRQGTHLIRRHDSDQVTITEKSLSHPVRVFRCSVPERVGVNDTKFLHERNKAEIYAIMAF